MIDSGFEIIDSASDESTLWESGDSDSSGSEADGQTHEASETQNIEEPPDENSPLHTSDASNENPATELEIDQMIDQMFEANATADGLNYHSEEEEEVVASEEAKPEPSELPPPTWNLANNDNATWDGARRLRRTFLKWLLKWLIFDACLSSIMTSRPRGPFVFRPSFSPAQVWGLHQHQNQHQQQADTPVLPTTTTTGYYPNEQHPLGTVVTVTVTRTVPTALAFTNAPPVTITVTVTPTPTPTPITSSVRETETETETLPPTPSQKKPRRPRKRQGGGRRRHPLITMARFFFLPLG